jgi:hypothetical protein
MGTRAGNSKHPLHHSLRRNDQRVGDVCQPGLHLLTALITQGHASPSRCSCTEQYPRGLLPTPAPSWKVDTLIFAGGCKRCVAVEARLDSCVIAVIMHSLGHLLRSYSLRSRSEQHNQIKGKTGLCAPASMAKLFRRPFEQAQAVHKTPLREFWDCT